MSSTALAQSKASEPEWNLTILMDILKRNGSMQAHFIESKHVRMLDAPVESSGELAYLTPHRLEKKVLKPRVESLVLDGDVMSMERGTTKRSLNVSEYPEIGALVQSMRAALGGDRVAMEKYFVPKLSGTRQRWSLTLTPRQARAVASLREIRLGGDDNYLHTIEVWLADGDWSVMSIDRPQIK